MILAIQNVFKLFRQYCQHEQVVIVTCIERLVQLILMIENVANYINQQDFRVLIMFKLIDDATGGW